MYIFKGKLVANDNKLWSQHVEIPNHITLEILETKNKRVWCTIEEGEPFQCAITAKGGGLYVIKVNKALGKKYKLQLEDLVSISLAADNTKHGLPMPEAFEATINEYEGGGDLYQALSEGKRRTLLYIVGQLKDEDKQIAASYAILDHLSIHGKKIDYKLLHQEIKEVMK